MEAKTIQIRRYDSTLNSGSGGWDYLQPKTLATNIFGGWDSVNNLYTSPLINSDNKISNNFIPDWVSSGSIYATTISGTQQGGGGYAATLSSATFVSAFLVGASGTEMKSKFHNRFNGAYFTISNDLTLTIPLYSSLGFTYLDDGETRTIHGVYVVPQGLTSPINSTGNSNTIYLQSGDMLLVDDTGYDGTSSRSLTLYVINNVYNHADSSEYGIVKLASYNNGTGAVDGDNSDVISKSVLSSVLSNGYQPLDDSLTDISTIGDDTSYGLLKFTSNGWTIDNSSYVTGNVVNTQGSESVTIDGTSITVVTRNTDQTITGSKTFGASILADSDVNLGGNTFEFKDLHLSGKIYTAYGATGSTQAEITLPSSSGTLALKSELIHTYLQSTTPSNPNSGDIWFQTSSSSS